MGRCWESTGHAIAEKDGGRIGNCSVLPVFWPCALRGRNATASNSYCAKRKLKQPSQARELFPCEEARSQRGNQAHSCEDDSLALGVRQQSARQGVCRPADVGVNICGKAINDEHGDASVPATLSATWAEKAPKRGTRNKRQPSG